MFLSNIPLHICVVAVDFFSFSEPNVCEKRINHKRALFVIGDTSDTYFNAYLIWDYCIIRSSLHIEHKYIINYIVNDSQKWNDKNNLLGLFVKSSSCFKEKKEVVSGRIKKVQDNL